jgi:misacylated tRNA(Ala) deacylase
MGDTTPATGTPTEALYHLDSTIREFEATVLDAGPDGIILDRTAFFPGGGGQPADKGLLIWNQTEHPVIKLSGRGGQVIHQIEASVIAAGPLPEPGAKIHGRLDWEHRYALMRTHTALHILCGVIWRDFQAQVTGGSMKPLSARMDFELDGMPADLARTIEERVNAEVEVGRDVHVSILPREEAMVIPDLIRTKINLLPESIREVRIVDIEGLDRQADGGTHVNNTREVGRVRVVKHESKGKINKRLHIAIE